MKPTLTIANAQIYLGNNLDVLPMLESNSVDSIVCDPPYELGFMGKSWDSSGIAYSVELWKECLRVLKPGGHLLAFGGTRTWHRLAVAIEDAGFEIRDNIAWLYGSGFPKSHNISKAIDKMAGAEREILGRNPNSRENATKDNTLYESGTVGKTDFVTVSATDDAKKWDGWGTALKPAHEPIVVARKPVEGTIAENVLTYGTGAINIDATRIGTQGGTQGAGFGEQSNVYGNGLNGNFGKPVDGLGRWPANIILDEYIAKLLDEQSGILKSGDIKPYTRQIGYGINMFNWTKFTGNHKGDSGGASRFFYVAKANKRDRNEGEVANTHPTVKPTALMQYLIRLVTPNNGVVLDPFTGSGSTGKAAILENKRFIGIELTAEYLPIIEGRLTYAYETVRNNEQIP